LVFAYRDDDRLFRIVDARGNLPLQRPAEGAFEVAEGFGTGLANAAVLVLGRDNVLLAARLDARQSQLLAEDASQLFQSQLDFEDVPAWLVARAGVAVALRRTQWLADIAIALSGAAGTLLTVTKLRNVDLRQGDADEVLALLADHLAAADVLAEVAFHLAADDLAEALMIAFDSLSHSSTLANQPQMNNDKRRSEI